MSTDILHRSYSAAVTPLCRASLNVFLYLDLLFQGSPVAIVVARAIDGTHFSGPTEKSDLTTHARNLTRRIPTVARTLFEASPVTSFFSYNKKCDCIFGT